MSNLYFLFFHFLFYFIIVFSLYSGMDIKKKYSAQQWRLDRISSNIRKRWAGNFRPWAEIPGRAETFSIRDSRA